MKCLLFLSFIILKVSPAFECPSNEWFRFRNKCFLTGIWITFQENVDFCKSRNSTTASIHSTEENDLIKSKSIPFFPLLLDIRQVDFNSLTYAWLDGSLYNYSNWVSREGEKTCAGAYILYDGKWYDRTDCDEKCLAVCQIDFDSPNDKMPSQMNQLSSNLKPIKAEDMHEDHSSADSNIGLVNNSILPLVNQSSGRIIKHRHIRTPP